MIDQQIGVGPAIAAVMTREVYYRQFDNWRHIRERRCSSSGLR
jgi:hypothetical protein